VVNTVVWLHILVGTCWCVYGALLVCVWCTVRNQSCQLYATSLFNIFAATLHIWIGRYSSVGIATRYGLDCTGIESRWRRVFPHPTQTGSGAQPASYTMGNGSFPGVKRPGRGVDHQPPSSAEVKKRVEPYSYSPFGLRSRF
jgi:hypothetical protein